MKTQIIKPKKSKDEKIEKQNIITPIIYILLGGILAFKSNEAVKIIFYIIGLLVIVYGIKTLITGYQNKDVPQIKNVNMSIAFVSITLGLLIMLFSGALEISIRYILGFFLIYLGISRMISEVAFGNLITLGNISNIVLIVLGMYSIIFSNAILVIIGWVLIINGVFLIWEYFK